MNFGAVIGVLITLLTGLVGIGALMLIIAMLGMILTALCSGMMDIRRALAQGSMERQALLGQARQASEWRTVEEGR